MNDANQNNAESVPAVTLLHERALRLLREGDAERRALGLAAEAVRLYVQRMNDAEAKSDIDQAAAAASMCRQLLEQYGETALVLARVHRDAACSALRLDPTGAERDVVQALRFYDEARLVPTSDKIAESEALALARLASGVCPTEPQNPPRRVVHNIDKLEIYREHTLRTYNRYCNTCSAYAEDLFHFPCSNVGPVDLCARCRHEVEGRCLPAVDAWWRTMAHNGTTPRGR